MSDELVVDESLVVGITLGYIPGDANGDGLINVLDVIAITNFFIGNLPDEFCFLNADVNEDDVINILEIIATVNLFASK